MDPFQFIPLKRATQQMTAHLYPGGLLLFRLCLDWRKDNNTSFIGALSRDCKGLKSAQYCQFLTKLSGQSGTKIRRLGQKRVRPLCINFIREFRC
jgi:hypothetical protein